MLKKYYRLTLVHTYRRTNRGFIFWGENHCGYQQDINRAGLYDFKEDKDWVNVEKSIIDKIKLPTNDGKFFVPNIGDYRKLFGITEMDLSQLDYESRDLSGYGRDYFYCDYPYTLETIKEEYQTKLDKTGYEVSAKDDICEFWYFNDFFNVDTPSKAISLAFKEWSYAEDYFDNFIGFKKTVTCRRRRITTFKRWRK